MFAGRHFLSFGFTSLGHRQVTECSAYHEESIMTEDRYYAVRMLWVRDDEIWQKYQEMAKPVLARHDVRVEHWLETDKIVGEGMDKPDLIVCASPLVAGARYAQRCPVEFGVPMEVVIAS
jgi:hypothetical protein